MRARSRRAGPTQPSQAPTAIDLGGRVVDDAKRPLANVAVSLGAAPLKAPQSLQAVN